MDQVITFTLEEVWHLILAICGGIVAISGAVAVIVQIIKKLRHPNRQQNEDIADLKNRMKKVEDRLEEGNAKFKEEERQTRELEEDLKTTIRMIIEGLQALTAHALDGTSTDELRKAKQNLDSYLLKQL